MAKLLVIDDDKFFVKVMSIALRARGHEVDCAYDGEAGEAAFDAKAFDAVICDMVMPHQDGLETIRSLRSKRPEVAMIAVSGGLGGATDLDVLSIADKFGAHVSLKKPFQPMQLAQAVDAAIAKAASGKLAANA
jgi:DNA-binding response OmpR family regulator